MAAPPYLEIADLLKEGRVVPFLGAGVNHVMRPPDETEWDYEKSAFPPDGRELARYLARRANFPSEKDYDINDLPKVSSYFVDRLARRQLRRRLRKIFDREYGSSSIHSYLAEIARQTPLLIVTTNYDDLTEQAFDKLGLPYDLVVHPVDRTDYKASVLWWEYGASAPQPVAPNTFHVDLEKITVIYKMHGTMFRRLEEWDNYVITEEDYIDFLSRMMTQSAVPKQFLNHFRTRQFLFLGYGLQDWNLRVMLRTLRNGQLPNLNQVDPSSSLANLSEILIESDPYNPQGEELPSWAIQLNPSELEERLWDSRKVQIFNVDISEFVRELRDLKK